MANKAGMFLLGGLIGAAAVFFTSPRSGFENRNLAKDTATALLGSDPCEACGGIASSATAVAQSAAEKTQELAKVVAEKGQEFYVTASNMVQEKVNGTKADAPEKVDKMDEADELRKKIAAARERIAAQVVKNAEESAQIELDPEAACEVVAEAVVAEVAEAVSEAEE